MKYLVAVSGGVDSVVLLDMMARQKKSIIVAHFDHGIRADSAADARFVEALAVMYGYEFVTKREMLGSGASEAFARQRRYAFLRAAAKQHNAQLVTAHHQDDLIETIALNISRGTGWRGLAVFGDNSILRPLIGMKKSQLYKYALFHQLEWVEDETNQTNRYLRNRLRRRLANLEADAREQLIKKYQSQRQLRSEIEKYLNTILPQANNRDFLRNISEPVALELLRSLTNAQLTRPQLRRALHGILTLQPAKRVEAGGGITIQITRRGFIVENTGKML